MPIWGRNIANPTESTGANWCRCMGGTSPSTAYMKLKSVTVYVGGTHTAQVRVAVYQGGALDDPTGATLVHDFGLTSGSGINQFLTLSATGDVDLVANTVTWVCIRGNDAGFTSIYQTDSGGAGDYQTVRGRFQATGVSLDETVAWPSTFPTGGSFSDFWYSFYLTYNVEPPEVSDDKPETHKTEQLVEQNTSSTTFVNIPGTELKFTPSKATEKWLVFVSGVLTRSTSTAETSAEIQILINGTAVDLCGHQFNAATTPNGAGFVSFELVTGVTTEQTVQPQYRAAAGSTYANYIRVVACRAPDGADVHYTDSDATTQTSGSNQSILALNFTPLRAGNYFVFGKVSHREAPGGSTSQAWVLGADSTQHPNTSGVHHSCARDAWNPLFVCYREALGAGSQSISVRFTSSGSGGETSEHRYRKLLVFREDAWDSSEYDFVAGQTATTNTAFQTKNSLTTQAPPDERDYLVIQSARIAGNSTSTAAQKSGELREGGATLARTNHKINRDGSATQGYHHTIGVVDVKARSAAVTYTNGFLSPDGISVECAESVILALRYPAKGFPNPPFYGSVA